MEDEQIHSASGLSNEAGYTANHVACSWAVVVRRKTTHAFGQGQKF